uniref:Ig-like domain-containing protein n=1 Tax=Equus asinus TaxID=9793 RepID=A0A8C4M4K9_EQUAS
MQTEDLVSLPKAVVSLEPPWNNVLREDSVTLKCQGAHTPEDNPTQWFHNGSPIPTQVQPSYSFKAQENDSGDYRCQTGQTSLSDPVHLDVISWSVEEGPATVFFFLHWFQIAFCLVMGLLFAVDTGLYVSVQRDLPRSVGDGKNCNVRWSQSPENK